MELTAEARLETAGGTGIAGVQDGWPAAPVEFSGSVCSVYTVGETSSRTVAEVQARRAAMGAARDTSTYLRT